MASVSDIATFRLLINEPNNVEPWTDIKISALLDTYLVNGVPDLDWAASDAWTKKASATTNLVDVTENGSSRKLSDVHKNYLSMAAYYRSRSTQATSEVTGSRPRTRAIVRP